MREEMTIISFRIPKSMDRDIGAAVKTGGYASRTEFMREALREKIYPRTSETRGVLKGKVKATSTKKQKQSRD